MRIKVKVVNWLGGEIAMVTGRGVGGVFCVHPSLESAGALFTITHAQTGLALPVRLTSESKAVRIARAALKSGIEWDGLTIKKSRTQKNRKLWREFKKQQGL